jgi:type 2 lantibiotic biosynthesis protein LanM
MTLHSSSDGAAAERRIRKIVAQAASLEERLEIRETESAGAPPEGVAQCLGERWRAVLSSGPDALERRLSWDGLTMETVLFRLAQCREPVQGALPAWASILLEYARTADERTGYAPSNLDSAAGETLPFGDLLLPFVKLAQLKIANDLGNAYAQFTPAAHGMLGRALLKQLSWVCQRVLGLEFSIFRATQPITSVDPCAAYRAFVDRNRSDGLLEIFSNYPVLARLVGTVTEQWIDASSEMLRRLWVDSAAVTERFGSMGCVGKVTAVQPLLSDLHNGGRSVCGLTFESGGRIVYKPKDVSLEERWNGLLDWINAESGTTQLRTFSVLARDGYGWAEYVEARPCTSVAETRAFSRRAGMLLFLAYLLDATDLHYENIVRCGEHPVLIDLETLLHPWVAAPGGMDGEDTPGGSARETVLRSGLLPTGVERSDTGPDLSGFRRGAPPVVTPPIRWNAINSDAMEMTEQHARFSTAPLANSDGEWMEPTAIMEGFREMYDCACAWRDRWSAPDSPLQAFSQCDLRFVFRPTGDYGRLLFHSLKPRLLRDGADRSIFLEALNRAALDGADRPSFWPILAAERQALEAMNVPLFLVRSDSTDMVLASGEVIPAYFLEPPITRVMNRLQALGEEDLQRQLGVIQTPLGSMTRTLA